MIRIRVAATIEIGEQSFDGGEVYILDEGATANALIAAGGTVEDAPAEEPATDI